MMALLGVGMRRTEQRQGLMLKASRPVEPLGGWPYEPAQAAELLMSERSFSALGAKRAYGPAARSPLAPAVPDAAAEEVARLHKLAHRVEISARKAELCPQGRSGDKSWRWASGLGHIDYPRSAVFAIVRCGNWRRPRSGPAVSFADLSYVRRLCGNIRLKQVSIKNSALW
jgi:hypothetical protein